MNDDRMTHALVVGRGGIGTALATKLAGRMPVTVWSRSDGIDPTDETSVERAAAALPAPPTYVFVTTGMLHDDRQSPERSLRHMDATAFQRSFLINTIAPSLIAKHVLPRLPRDSRAVFAVLGARVGSIGDNRTGGWHAYRASKAALVMLVKNWALEMARTHPKAVIVALHPGTVDTPMSKPFQRGVDPDKLFSAARSADYLIEVAEALVPEQTGGQFGWDGVPIAP